MKKKIILLTFSMIFLVIFILVTITSILKKTDTSTVVLGNYYGISDDKKWETSFRVFENEKYNNDIMVLGSVACIDDELRNSYSDDEIQDCHITGLQSDNKGSFDGDLVYDNNEYRLLTFVMDGSAPFYKMIIVMRGETIEIQLSKTDD
jgi:hypothetical protein